jgi:hypothetical protein
MEEAMNEIKNKVKVTAVRVKNHVARHKGAYAMGAVAFGCYTQLRANNKAFTEFLTEKGIDPNEFWIPDWNVNQTSV